MKRNDENLRLGFHYHIPMMHDEAGRPRTAGYLGRFLDSIAVECKHLTCFMHSPRSDEIPQMDYTLTSSNLSWINIGPHTSIPRRMLQSRQIANHVREYADMLDVLLIRGPSPLLPAMASAARNIPIALLIVGSYLDGVDDLPQRRWRKEAIRLWSYWNYRQQMRVAKKSFTFVNSHKLYEQMHPSVPHLVETRTTTLSTSDFFEREDTCLSKPVRLLYTGRIDRAKGLFEMVEALQMLRERGQDIVLDLVGWPQVGDPIVDQLMQAAHEKGIHDYIFYHGYKAVGPELFSYYKQADIYIIASQNSEGFPRTIWEALAHSLPVVATKVGSIPNFLENGKNSCLVEPKNSHALSEAIMHILENPTLRQVHIRNGRKLAEQNTLEKRTAEIMRSLEDWLDAKGKTTLTA